MKQIAQPLTVFLIGATGDLAKKKILKALYMLHSEQLLPSSFNLVGNARSQYSNDEFKKYVKEVVSPQDKIKWQAFADNLYYVAGDVSDARTFQHLLDLHDSLSHCGNHLWYVATLPRLYPDLIAQLEQAGLHQTSCGWTKILLEKPFGTDLRTAQHLNEQLLSVFEEDLIYRIDHFLAKETVQNLLVFRFANGMFEHLWSHQYVDHIQITASETIGINGREDFYDETGALRDVVQNHVLQMLATTLMEEPESLSSEAVRTQRHALLTALQLGTVETDVIYGQYQSGSIDGQVVSGYQQEAEQLIHSQTETAVALKLQVDNKRWQGVPIYIRAGKRLQRSVTEISVVFKEPTNTMFNRRSLQIANVLTFRIQPNEGVIIRMQVKKPGLALDMEQVPMQFCFETEFQANLVEAYVKLIYDAVQGDATFFPRADGIEATWQFVQPLLDAQAAGKLVAQPYAAGSWGPKEFSQLMTADGRDWIVPSVDVCQLPSRKK